MAVEEDHDLAESLLLRHPETTREARIGPIPATSFRRSGVASMISKLASHCGPCAPAHPLNLRPATLLPLRAWESAMAPPFYTSDEACPDHDHHFVVAAALIIFPLLILASVVSSLFGMT
jgi:hypothetical protein